LPCEDKGGGALSCGLPSASRKPNPICVCLPARVELVAVFVATAIPRRFVWLLFAFAQRLRQQLPKRYSDRGRKVDFETDGNHLERSTLRPIR
jgi:hypothetical protein